jgi:hypothetical protein
MWFRGSFSSIAFRLTMASLIVLWPVLCCCSFNHHGCDGHEDVSHDHDEAGHAHDEDHADRVQHGGLTDEHEHGVATGHGARHGDHGDAAGSCCGTVTHDGCSCEKSRSTLAQVDDGRRALVSAADMAAWLPAVDQARGALEGPLRRIVPRNEHSPPRLLLKLRVLRI